MGLSFLYGEKTSWTLHIPQAHYITIVPWILDGISSFDCAGQGIVPCFSWLNPWCIPQNVTCFQQISMVNLHLNIKFGHVIMIHQPPVTAILRDDSPILSCISSDIATWGRGQCFSDLPSTSPLYIPIIAPIFVGQVTRFDASTSIKSTFAIFYITIVHHVFRKSACWGHGIAHFLLRTTRAHHPGENSQEVGGAIRGRRSQAFHLWWSDGEILDTNAMYPAVGWIWI